MEVIVSHVMFEDEGRPVTHEGTSAARSVIDEATPSAAGSAGAGRRDGTRRIVSLECARGIASVIVLLHHFTLAFVPWVREPFGKGGIGRTPIFAFLNGSGAVVFFFALSGFVLTRRFYSRPSGPALAAAALKRLPRLMIPAGASILIGWFILSHGGDAYRVAADFSKSEWLARFGNAGLPDDLTPSLLDAFRQSLFVFLVPDQHYYNSNLWTMMNEFYGSLVVFALVFLLRFSLLRSALAVVALHLLLIAICWAEWPFFVPFVGGSLLAFLVTVPGARQPLRLSPLLTWGLIAAALIGFSVDELMVNSLASIAVLVALLGDAGLAAHLSGTLGAWIGRLSFPLYLVHTLVILSVSSDVYVRLAIAGMTGAALVTPVFLVTLATALAASLPFLFLDTVWVGWLNRRVKALIASS